MSVLQTVSGIVNRNAPIILTIVGTAGVFATAIFTGKATLEAAEKVRHIEKTVDRHLTKVEIIEVSWRYFIPPAMLAIGTTAAVIGLHSVHTRRATALLSAYSITDTAFREYQHKVANILGDKKELTLREEIAAEQIRKNPPPENREVVIIGSGNVLCLEVTTGRYFWSDYERIRKAENTINAQLIHEMSASQNEFYSLIGIPQTSIGDQLGWNIDHLMEIVFGCELDPDNKPCLAIDYRVAPRTDYYKLHI